MSVREHVYPNPDYWDAVQKMANRMAFSEQKYGPIAEQFPSDIAVDQIRARVGKYLKDGNTEWLIDAANYCLIEALHPTHADAHFVATGSEESIDPRSAS